MDENKLKFGVGVLVVSAIGIAVILTFLFGAFPSVLKREYLLNVQFPSAAGVSENTQVLRDGVRIGSVSNIELLPEGVLVTLSIDENWRLTHEYLPTITSGSFVTGDAQLEFVKATEQQLDQIFVGNPEIIPTLYTDKEYVKYGVKDEDPLNVLVDLETEVRDTMRSVRDAGQAIEQAGTRFDQLSEQFQRLLGTSDTTVEDVTQQALKTLEEFELATKDLRTIVNDPAIKRTLESLPQLSEDASGILQLTKDSLDSLGRASNQFEQVGETVNRLVEKAEVVVEDVQNVTGPFGARGENFADQISETLDNLNATLVQVEAFGQLFNNSNGTFRQLLEDEELYGKVRRTVENLEQATAQVRPILDDIRIFSDKIARDPRQLGVRGAVSSRPSGYGLK